MNSYHISYMILPSHLSLVPLNSWFIMNRFPWLSTIKSLIFSEYGEFTMLWIHAFSWVHRAISIWITSYESGCCCAVGISNLHHHHENDRSRDFLGWSLRRSPKAQDGRPAKATAGPRLTRRKELGPPAHGAVTVPYDVPEPRGPTTPRHLSRTQPSVGQRNSTARPTKADSEPVMTSDGAACWNPAAPRAAPRPGPAQQRKRWAGRTRRKRRPGGRRGGAGQSNPGRAPLSVPKLKKISILISVQVYL